MSGTDETELSRIREEYGDLMNEEEKANFPTAENLRIHRLADNSKRAHLFEFPIRTGYNFLAINKKIKYFMEQNNYRPWAPDIQSGKKIF